MDPKTFIFFGRSGSGKGTQARLLRKYLENRADVPVLYIETGKYFRDFVASDGYTAGLAQAVLSQGELLPVFLPIWLWGGIFVDRMSGREHLILDGLSRRAEEAQVLDSALKFYNRKTPCVIYLNVPRERAFEMMRSRGRSDDTEEYINSRLDWFNEYVVPAMEYFKDNPDYLFLDIDGNRPIAAVHQEILARSKLV